jgi:hypothetical protein
MGLCGSTGVFVATQEFYVKAGNYEKPDIDSP